MLLGKGVCYKPTNQANSAFHPFGVSKCVVIHAITWPTAGWRPLNSRPELRIAL